MADKIEEMLTVERLKEMGEKTFTEKVTLDGKKFTVKFRRLHYGELAALQMIPKEEGARYIKTLIKAASISPKFETVDDVGLVPHPGFVRSYGDLIIFETTKNPFLDKG